MGTYGSPRNFALLFILDNLDSSNFISEYFSGVSKVVLRGVVLGTVLI